MELQFYLYLPHSPFPCVLIQKWNGFLQIKKTPLPSRCKKCFKCSTMIDYVYNFYNAFLKCPNCSSFTYVDKPIDGDVLVRNLNVDCVFPPDRNRYREYDEKLKEEFKLIQEFEKDKNKEFLTLVIKFLTDCRQKFKNFYAFNYFLDKNANYPTFQINQELLESSLNQLETNIKFWTAASGDAKSIINPSEQMILVDTTLSTLRIRLKAHCDSLWEENWRFIDVDIQKAFQRG